MLSVTSRHRWNDPCRDRDIQLLSGTLDFTVSLLWLLIGAERDREVWLLPGLDWPRNPPVVRQRFRGTFRACSAVVRTFFQSALHNIMTEERESVFRATVVLLFHPPWRQRGMCRFRERFICRWITVCTVWVQPVSFSLSVETERLSN